MNIAIIGYGKMGKEIEKIINKSSHSICSIIDSTEEWEENADELENADVAIEFSQPSAVIQNIKNCFELNLPIIVGTTGWEQYYDEIKALCLKKNQAIVIGSNFSIGVNMFFSLNKKMAEMNAKFPLYTAEIEEIHHTTKLDSPSGTAIQIAKDILSITEIFNKNEKPIKISSENLSITSKRVSNTPGTHIITYNSPNDSIEIKHVALSRKGFAMGAVYAAEWLLGKKGFYSNFDVFEL